MTRYVTSDQHFGHEEIIGPTNRPFDTVAEMEAGLRDRWNDTVDEDDVVYALGDFCYKSKTTHDYWDEKLNGNIILVRGNHDNVDANETHIPIVDSCTVRASNGVWFHLVHNPSDLEDVAAWVIHGHVHNNDKYRFPFLNRDDNLVNVSVELTEYRPVELDEIARRVSDEEGSYLTIDTELR